MTREEMWEEFENQLKREVHTPITMDYYNSIKFAEQGIAETVAKWKERLEQEPCEDCQYKEWLKEEVEQAPKIDGDCISREGAIEVVRSHWEDILHPVNLRIQEELKELPSVNPIEPKTGHWVKKSQYGNDYCSECDYELLMYEKTKYCPNCGIKMESEGKR